jgi:RimJ/RimL family protein N-acetyltransferase
MSAAARVDWRTALPCLIGPGVILREPCLADVPALRELVGDGAAWRFTARRPDTPPDYGRFIAWVQAERELGRRLCYAMVTESQAITALVMARRMDTGFRSADLVLLPANPPADDSGVVAGVEVILDFLVQEVVVHRIETRTSTAAETAIMRQAGAVMEGILRRAEQVGDSVVDQELWAIVDDDWRARRGASAGLESRPAPRQGLPCDVGQHDLDWRSDPLPAWSGRLPELGSRLVTLREIERRDAPVLFETLPPQDVELCIDPAPSTIAVFECFIEWARAQREAGRAACFAVVPAGEEAAAGLILVRQVDPRFFCADWGIVLARRVRGKGLAGHACRLILPFVFDVMGVRRLEGRTSTGNLPAAASMRQLGATHEARLRRAFHRGVEYADDDLWTILADDWHGFSQPRRTAP